MEKIKCPNCERLEKQLEREKTSELRYALSQHHSCETCIFATSDFCIAMQGPEYEADKTWCRKWFSKGGYSIADDLGDNLGFFETQEEALEALKQWRIVDRERMARLDGRIAQLKSD